MKRDTGQFFGEGLATAIGDQRNAPSAGQQRAGERFGRKQMATGATARQDDEMLAHISLSPKRRRVSASVMPMPSPRASSDDPP